MLTLMRRLTQNKFFGGILFGLVILSMAVWGPGISDIFSGGIGSNIVSAGERGTSEQQLNRKLENYLNNVRAENPGNALSRKQAAEQGILDQIFTIERSRIMTLGYARSLGADASGKALLDEVQGIPDFRDPLTDKFDTEYYRTALAQRRINQSDFENDRQDRLTITYLEEGISAGLVPPTDIARVQAIFDGEVRYISWLPLQKDALPATPEPTEEDLKAFYASNLTAFEAPERRQLTMLDISADDFLHQAVITDEKIEEAYEATKYSRLAIPEKRTFKEMVFADEESAKAAFGVLAVGGDLVDPPAETTTRTLTVNEVVLEAFKVQLFTRGVDIGAVVGPIETNGSYLIGQLTEIIPGTPKTLEETRDEIRAELASDAAELEYYKALNEFDDLIGQGLGVDAIAQRYGAPTISFAPVDQRGLTEKGEFLQGIATSPEALAQAFQFQEGTMTDRFDLDDRTILIEIDKIIPKSTPEFEVVSDRVKSAYIANKEGESLLASGEAIKATIDTGSSTLSEQAALYKSEVQTPERGLRRTAFDRSLPQPVLQAAFSGDAGDVSVVQGRTPTELIILQIDRIDRPKTEELDVLAPISKPKITEQLRQDLLGAFEIEVQNAVEVETNDRAFAAYKRRLIEDQ